MRTTGPSNTDLAPAPAYTPPGFWERWQRKSGSNFAVFIIPYVVCEYRPHAAMVSRAVQNLLWPRGGAHGHLDWGSAAVAPSVAVGGLIACSSR